MINLAGSPARLAQATASLGRAGLEFERVEAVDGTTLTPAEIAASYDESLNRKHYFARLSRGEIACFLSHRKAWQHFLESSCEEVGVFLEDDAELSAPASVLREASAVFDHASGPLVLKLHRLITVFDRQNRPPSAKISFPLVPPVGAVAQAINRPAAAALLAATGRIFEPVDVAVQRWWIHGARIAQITPNAFKESSALVGGSTLRTGPPLPAAARLHRELVRPPFQIRLLARSVWEHLSVASRSSSGRRAFLSKY